VSDVSPLDKHLELIKRVVPGGQARRRDLQPGRSQFGLDHRGAEEGRTGRRRDAGGGRAAARTVDVASAAQSLVGKVDVIYAPTDNNVMSAFEGIIKVASRPRSRWLRRHRRGHPWRRRGAGPELLRHRPPDRQIVVRILKGEAAGKIASQTSTTFELHVNPGAAQKQGVTLSDELISRPRWWSSKPEAGGARDAPHPIPATSFLLEVSDMSLIASLGAIEIGLIFGLVALVSSCRFASSTFRT